MRRPRPPFGCRSFYPLLSPAQPSCLLPNSIKPVAGGIAVISGTARLVISYEHGTAVVIEAELYVRAMIARQLVSAS